MIPNFTPCHGPRGAATFFTSRYAGCIFHPGPGKEPDTGVVVHRDRRALGSCATSTHAADPVRTSTIHRGIFVEVRGFFAAICISDSMIRMFP